MPKLQLVPRTRPRSLDDALQDFYLSKRSQLLAPRTLEFYARTAGEFDRWLREDDVHSPEEVTARLVRAYLASVKARNVSDATVHLHAEGVKAFVRFLHREGYITQPIVFDMPRPAQQRMRLPSVEQVKALLAACETPRDKALLLVMADTGARVSEVAALHWGDVEPQTGVVHIQRGKGRKARSVIVGVHTRRALLKYRRTVDHEPEEPLWVGIAGPLGREGIRHVLRKLSRKTHIKVSCHDFRRFFATASLRAGMNPIHVQSLLGHTSLEMTRRYLSVIEDDLLQAHEQHGPVDRFLR